MLLLLLLLLVVGGTMIDGADVQSCTFNHQIPPRSRYFNMARRVIFINATSSTVPHNTLGGLTLREPMEDFLFRQSFPRMDGCLSC